MAELFEYNTQIITLLDTIKQATLQIEHYTSQIAFDTNTNKKEADVVFQLGQKNSKKIIEIISKIKNNKDLAKDNSFQPFLNKIQVLFNETIKKYQNAKSEYCKEYENVLARRIKTIDSSIDDKSIKRLIYEDNFTLAQLIEPNDQAVSAYSDAVQRGKEVKRLIISIIELNEMMTDLNNLITQQSETLVTIESNVEKAHIYVKKGNEHMKDSIALAKKTRKCYCCMLFVFIILIIIALVVGLSIAFSFNKL
jgi:t-SNARE complex subunit (syntaxin)